MKETAAERMKKFMKEKKISITEMAKKLDIASPSNISNWFIRGSIPKGKEDEIADILGITRENLIGINEKGGKSSFTNEEKEIIFTMRKMKRKHKEPIISLIKALE